MTNDSDPERPAFNYLCQELLEPLENLNLHAKALLCDYIVANDVSEDDLKACRELCSGLGKILAHAIGRNPISVRFMSTREGVDRFLATLVKGSEFTHREALIWITENTLMSPAKFKPGPDGEMPLPHYITVELGRKVKSGEINRIEKGVYSVS